jgi:hypothetical protein
MNLVDFVPKNPLWNLLVLFYCFQVVKFSKKNPQVFMMIEVNKIPFQQIIPKNG